MGDLDDLVRGESDTAIVKKGRPIPPMNVPEGASWAPNPGASTAEQSRLRRLHAMQMRAAGASYEEIGVEIGVEADRSRQIVMDGLKRAVIEPAEEIRHQEHFRLEKLMSVVWPRAMKGDGFAVDRVLRIMERKAPARPRRARRDRYPPDPDGAVHGPPRHARR